ncbi:MAG: hypothetical protein D6738_05545 [Acidobacteria bacterium]|nr:MAG: hypothetical protein D6738_05545 [Acidobacteriota bacterium]
MDRAPRTDVDLRHVAALTDDTGIFQHAYFGVPDPHHGYCTDDNARALIVAVRARACGLALPDRVDPMRYLAFLRAAFDPARGVLRNFLGWDRRWREDEGSEDAQARGVWALAEAAAQRDDPVLAEAAGALFDAALPRIARLEALRARAFAILALARRTDERPDGHAAGILRRHAAALEDAFRVASGPGWAWFEDAVTYDNGRLPQALLAASAALDARRWRDVGLEALRFLLDGQTGPGGVLKLVGNRGWWRRGSRPAPFDEQPLEPAALVEACLLAARITGDRAWRAEAERCHRWYHGGNVLGLSLYDPHTGGCFDGLEPDGVNRNRGAEATLSLALSALALRAGVREPAR